MCVCVCVCVVCVCVCVFLWKYHRMYEADLKGIHFTQTIYDILSSLVYALNSGININHVTVKVESYKLKR